MAWWAIELTRWLAFVRMQNRKTLLVRQSDSQTVSIEYFVIFLLEILLFTRCREARFTKHYKYIARIITIMFLIILVLILTFRESKLGHSLAPSPNFVGITATPTDYPVRTKASTGI